MRALTLQAPRSLTWDETPEPDLEGAGEALVRPLAVATCDLDQPMIFGGTPFPMPIALGHECVGEVVAVGADVRAVGVGDRVVVPFQISCGTCERCRHGLTGDCERVAPLAMYGFGAFGGSFGGFLADLVRVPFADAMLVAVPEGVGAEAVASASDNIADAWRLIAPWLAEWPAAEVLVVGGAGAIGVYAVDIARALGAARVVYVDGEAGRLDVAADLGAEALARDPEPRRVGTFPITVDFSGTADGLHLALRSTAPSGHCTHAAALFGEDTPLPMLELYTRGVHLHVGRAAARPAIPAILRLVAAGRLHPERVTSEVVAFDAAADALLVHHTKLVMSRAA